MSQSFPYTFELGDRCGVINGIFRYPQKARIVKITPKWYWVMRAVNGGISGPIKYSTETLRRCGFHGTDDDGFGPVAIVRQERLVPLSECPGIWLDQDTLDFPPLTDFLGTLGPKKRSAMEKKYEAALGVGWWQD